MTKGFLTGFGVAILLLVALLIYRSYNVQCKCGFKYDAFSGGCVVDLNPPPCTDEGGGNGPGNKPGGSGSGSQTSVTLPGSNFPATCQSNLVVNCVIQPDWKAVEFTVIDTTGTIPAGSPRKVPVTLAISERDNSGRSCARIKGSIDATASTPTTIPFDSAKLAGTFPIATTSASGPPTDGLVASFNDPCSGTQTQMVVFPTRDPECGCKVPFKRD